MFYVVMRDVPADEAASLQAYLLNQKGRVRQCPTKGCGALIKKGEGCNHMHCTVCKMHFCWLCGFTSTSQSRVYEHLREIHGAIGEEWPLFDYNVLRRNFGAARFRNMNQLQLYHQQFANELNELDVLIPLVEEP
ncbi:IBR domain protein [Teladorsagia circumcincta]|uniref:IBR domain protein n=1 Tax=Teladorsagia circumcincta TaxID=45464 RepID=A0A2G9UI33_TELCI|nr:IBR domain protein [Teladorsagia circumcincta]